MSENHRLPDYLDHIQQAATDARSFVEGLDKGDFLADKRTQQAVIMSLIIVGEAATKVMDGYAEFTQAHAEMPWRSMRNMRNRMAHGYFDINLDVVWETVQEWLPTLLKQLFLVRQDANIEGESKRT
ncbi:hypothetical protein ALP66_02848 [Pseudomonas amygdali pv. photiniae]|uniref:Rha family transcriptional regulator n=1 Tax=Pseudomonas amygdali pv. photiniae TaxID=251724 RepID=A0A0P9XRG0_PSEA0|nr:MULTISPECIES: DUF86 domain-containing protein [Pseudomonas syringae group genomosp. 2]EGH04989.1 hypothetical protein PSYAE_24123 [Pseudomonas amygdali pv. aesculi str. 0893_23]KPW09154.1 hypothetical protein ALO90_200146 [Pseudomonas amygdali pv. aesculi]KPX67571.1 hypothetical protein ALO53_200189 [Pseudomonas amygdali pv. photiniae]MCQ3013747.1 DUF86 domain-containing protein [Pseudomonas savastanoi]RMS45329.1 hypothetical protein ALP66_02848 [Pseudomonas amygdali pv. photiniae]